MPQNTLHSRKQSSYNAAGSHEPQMHAYEVRPRKDHRGVDLISDAEFPLAPLVNSIRWNANDADPGDYNACRILKLTLWHDANEDYVGSSDLAARSSPNIGVTSSTNVSPEPSY